MFVHRSWIYLNRKVQNEIQNISAEGAKTYPFIIIYYLAANQTTAIINVLSTVYYRAIAMTYKCTQ